MVYYSSNFPHFNHITSREEDSFSNLVPILEDMDLQPIKLRLTFNGRIHLV